MLRPYRHQLPNYDIRDSFHAITLQQPQPRPIPGKACSVVYFVDAPGTCPYAGAKLQLRRQHCDEIRLPHNPHDG